MTKSEDYYRIPRKGVKVAGLSIVGLAALIMCIVVPANMFQSEKIAFMSDRDGSDEVYLMDGDGNGLRKLSSTGVEGFE